MSWAFMVVSLAFAHKVATRNIVVGIPAIHDNEPRLSTKRIASSTFHEESLVDRALRLQYPRIANLDNVTLGKRQYASHQCSYLECFGCLSALSAASARELMQTSQRLPVLDCCNLCPSHPVMKARAVPAARTALVARAGWFETELGGNDDDKTTRKARADEKRLRDAELRHREAVRLNRAADFEEKVVRAAQNIPEEAKRIAEAVYWDRMNKVWNHVPSQQAPSELKDQLNLFEMPLQPCSEPIAEPMLGISNSPFFRTQHGFCDWDMGGDDGWNAAICVTLTEEFFRRFNKRGATKVSVGENVCVNKWEWARAVISDPKLAEGLQLNCESTDAVITGVFISAKDQKGGFSEPLNKIHQVCGYLPLPQYLAPVADPKLLDDRKTALPPELAIDEYNRVMGR